MLPTSTNTSATSTTTPPPPTTWSLIALGPVTPALLLLMLIEALRRAGVLPPAPEAQPDPPEYASLDALRAWLVANRPDWVARFDSARDRLAANGATVLVNDNWQ